MPDVFDVLSKDHQEVRQMLDMLEQGRRGPGATDADRAKRKTAVERLVIEESKHEAMEETHFWPMVRERLPQGGKLADHAIEQEQEAKEVLDKLDRLDPSDSEFEKLLGEFITSGREHMGFEETQVWPALRRALSSQEADDLGRRIKDGKETAPTRPHPHTPPTPAALKAAGPVVSALDKARDAATGRGTGSTNANSSRSGHQSTRGGPGGTRTRGSGSGGTRTRGKSTGSAAASTRASTSDMTRAELYGEAAKLGVKGRSTMNKADLARHVAARRRAGSSRHS